MCPYVSEAQDNAVSSRIPVPASASLPRLPMSKKYKAPEPPSATRQGGLASKLKVGIVLLADFSKRHKAEVGISLPGVDVTSQTGLKISFTGPSDKMSDDIWVGHMSDDRQFSFD